jgi:hypothetical protein
VERYVLRRGWYFFSRWSAQKKYADLIDLIFGSFLWESAGKISVNKAS